MQDPSPAGSHWPHAKSPSQSWTPHQSNTQNTHIDGYTLIEELGRGGMGAVYLAIKHGRHYALKFNLASTDPEAEMRFQREAEAAAQVDRHPHIVGIHHFGQWRPPQQPTRLYNYIVFEFVEGQSLDAILEQRLLSGQHSELDQVLLWVKHIALALAHIHDCDIIHRDLKPANVMIRNSDQVALLADFGLAKALNMETLTKTGESFGTPAYMSPEQLSGQLRDPAIDVWALGVILYEATTGKKPFAGANQMALAKAVLTTTPTAPKQHQPALSDHLSDLIMDLLNKDVAQRPSIEEFLERFENIQRGQVSRFQTQRSQQWFKRLAVVLLMFIALAAGALGLRHWQRQAAQRQAFQALLERTLKAAKPIPKRPLEWLGHQLTAPELTPPQKQSFIELCQRLRQQGREHPESVIQAPSQAALELNTWAEILTGEAICQGWAADPQLTELRQSLSLRNIDWSQFEWAKDPAFANICHYLEGQRARKLGEWQAALKAWQQIDPELAWWRRVHPEFLKVFENSCLASLYQERLPWNWQQQVRSLLSEVPESQRAQWFENWNRRVHAAHEANKSLSGPRLAKSRRALEAFQRSHPRQRLPTKSVKELAFEIEQSRRKPIPRFLAQFELALKDPQHEQVKDFKINSFQELFTALSPRSPNFKDCLEALVVVIEAGYLPPMNKMFRSFLRSEGLTEKRLKSQPNSIAFRFLRARLAKSHDQDGRKASLQERVALKQQVVEDCDFVLGQHKSMSPALKAVCVALRVMALRDLMDHDAMDKDYQRLIDELKPHAIIHPTPERVYLELFFLSKNLRKQGHGQVRFLDRAEKFVRMRHARTQNESKTNRGPKARLLKRQKFPLQPLHPCTEGEFVDGLKDVVSRRYTYYKRQGNYVKALRDSQVLIDSEKKTTFLFMRGDILLLMGQVDKARDFYESSIANLIRGENDDWMRKLYRHLILAELLKLVQSHKKPQARDKIEQLYKAKPNADHAYGKAHLYIMLGQNQQASDWYQAVIKQHPEWAETNFMKNLKTRIEENLANAKKP